MFEIKISLKSSQIAGLELLRTTLVAQGIPEKEIAENQFKGRGFLSLFASTMQGRKKLEACLRSVPVPGIRISCRELQDSDWKTRWKHYFKPFMITPDIRLVPVWSTDKAGKKDSAAGKRTIFIDTTLAFGTGQHATTRMMADLIYSQRGALARFCDIGTGTGILSLVASRCGAQEIWALDYDAHSVATARANFRMNSCRYRYLKKTDVASFVAKPFNFVAANLLTEDLVTFRKKLLSLTATGGSLAVSGIHEDNYRSFRRRFDGKELACKKALKRKKWCAVLYKKRT